MRLKMSEYICPSDIELERKIDEMELKTLKDIEWEYSQKDYNKNIKAEAVKWVKRLKCEWNGKVRADWIKHFFNIENEDLK